MKSELEEVTIGIDFGGNKSGHAFVATAKARGYNNLIALKSERHFGEYDGNDIDRLAINFAQSVLIYAVLWTLCIGIMPKLYSVEELKERLRSIFQIR